MKYLKITNLIILVLLGVGAGIPKLMKMPQELTFLQSIGMKEVHVVLLGVFQLLSGVLLIFPKTRLIAAIVLAITLTVSAVALFFGGNTAFALVSVIPIILAGILIAGQLRSS